MKLLLQALTAAALLSAPQAIFAQTSGNTGLCNRININCSGPDYGGYESFDACWADQGAPYCPPYQPDPYGPHDYSGNPYQDITNPPPPRGIVIVE